MVLPPLPGDLTRLSARGDLTEIHLGLETLLEPEIPLELEVVMTVPWSQNLMSQTTAMNPSTTPTVGPIMAGRTVIRTITLGTTGPHGLTMAVVRWRWQQLDWELPL